MRYVEVHCIEYIVADVLGLIYSDSSWMGKDTELSP
jgi:hypothetical protein